ncbi:PRC-barrel domain-containing protein [Aneurinibacillus thermoaerophilus]|uniref:PRC-barrel domain-containing protein n=1 Tax=Aneurinibacillus thermoaerophilus TaxID=143495 RepID=A0A1G7YBW3_ANETH|nr:MULTISPECIES: PRC-barrel domain-containing protein [Aneurinibacillus]AMA72176.1 hypothetical protein ACH33_04445 [Aneurinibacillus sp. XH2]MED0676461.1 PRC-barrel domain-containing protein [Aneurinibacillus thermoaerophilus]MED0756013.1 PRC-barrel domain-containing protein [Aneurinibacillus thermoaerophilus]MED0759663.1 PRC-barrel domain-containing protein [Aneurinibacillus thermoaerophilus]QYY42058.1 PRC-barrel domain-containing protein [Aneurinibacillus thermoaerophilus]
MQRARDIIGLPVIELKRGKEVGYVHDLLFNERMELAGLLLVEKNFLRKGKYVPAEAICAIGADCVTITERAMVLFSSLPSNWICVQTGKAHMQNRMFITDTGEQLGFVEDVYFSAETGRIVGYELSNGILSDIMDGRKMIRSAPNIKMGEDTVIVSPGE